MSEESRKRQYLPIFRLSGISKKQMSRLQRIQNRCARLIFKKTQVYSFLSSSKTAPLAPCGRAYSIPHTFKSLNNLPPLHVIPSYHFQANGLQPHPSYPIHPYSGWGQGLFSLSPSPMEQTPCHDRGVPTITSFKKLIKTHLFPKVTG